MLAILAGAPTGCSGSSSQGADEYDLDIPTSWAGSVTNPFFTLVPGTTYEYEAATDEGRETIVVEVLAQRKTIMGVEATIVRDRVYVDGALIEDTFDWFAQDAQGHVWYLGEDVANYENGVLVDHNGSFEWGVDGALPGIIMRANPAADLGEEYRQEYYEGEAEDYGKVVALNQSVSVPHGNFTGCIKTEDWNALEPGILENKYYCPGIGMTLEVKVRGGNERVELIRVTSP